MPEINQVSTPDQTGIPPGVTFDDSPMKPLASQPESGVPQGVTFDDSPMTPLAASPKASTPLTEQEAASGDYVNQQAHKTTPMSQNTLGNVMTGVSQSMPVQLLHLAVAPPQSADEHIAASVSPGALIALRQAKGIVSSVKNAMSSSGDKFAQAVLDVKRAADEFHRGDYRNALSSAVSAGAGAAGIVDPVGVGTLGSDARELSEGARPGGNLATPLTRQVIDASTGLVGGEFGGEAAGELAQGAADATRTGARAVNKGVRNTAEAIKPEWLTKRPEVPAPQHGTPVRVESPLDSPTISKTAGGKDLSQEAVDTLRGHVGETIPVGSTAKTKLMEAVQPVTKTISDTAEKMNATVKDAPKFTTSVAQDDVFGEGALTSDIEKMKSDLPPSVRKPLSDDVDAVMEDADKALNSQDASEVLEQRRLLGNKIDWENIVKNPTTPAEAQNLARVKVYRALGDKIHSEIPETISLDKTLQPNLELRSHLTNRLGERVLDDPHAATAEAQSQAKLGKQKIQNDLHNEGVARNWKVLGPVVKGALVGAGASSAYETIKHLFM